MIEYEKQNRVHLFPLRNDREISDRKTKSMKNRTAS